MCVNILGPLELYSCKQTVILRLVPGYIFVLKGPLIAVSDNKMLRK